MLIEVGAATYARALYEAAVEKGVLEDVHHEVRFLAGRLRVDPELRVFIETPRIKKTEKKAVLDRALRGQVSDTFLHFVFLLIDKGRQLLLRESLARFLELYDLESGIVRVEAISAVPLAQDARDSLKERLAKTLHKRIDIVERVDPGILGGLIVRFAGKVADGSLRTALAKLRSRLVTANIGSQWIHED